MSLTEYAVRHRNSGHIRLVEAPNQAAALRRVAGDEYAVSIPTRAEMHKFAKDGLEIELWKAPESRQPQLEEGQADG